MSGELAEAYSYCEQLARTHYENFPVASRLLPARMRPHVAAVYAFARFADQDPARIRTIDASGHPEAVTSRLLAALGDLLP